MAPQIRSHKVLCSYFPKKVSIQLSSEQSVGVIHSNISTSNYLATVFQTISFLHGRHESSLDGISARESNQVVFGKTAEAYGQLPGSWNWRGLGGQVVQDADGIVPSDRRAVVILQPDVGRGCGGGSATRRRVALEVALDAVEHEREIRHTRDHRKQPVGLLDRAHLAARQNERDGYATVPDLTQHFVVLRHPAPQSTRTTTTTTSPTAIDSAAKVLRLKLQQTW